MKVNILVFGAGGQLGKTYHENADSFQWANFTFLDHRHVDVTSLKSIEYAVKCYNPSFIINCAAYTAVDKAENDIESCNAINTQACQNIIDVVGSKKIKILHFSSDYVYNSYNGLPIKEDDEKSPQSVYATSKLNGDEILLSGKAKTLILRVSWLVSGYGNNFIKTMIRLGNEKSEISVVNDQYGSPTGTHDLVKNSMFIIEKTALGKFSSKQWNDVYNYSSEGFVTWYDIAKEVMLIEKSKCKVNPIPSTEYLTSAKRPHWSVLSKQKIKQTFKIKIPHWREVVWESCRTNYFDNLKW